jgi:outer membrane biosynthesis protein TonB
MSVESLRQINAFHKDPKFGRLLLVSLIVHGLVWVAFTVDLFGTKTRPKPPIYYVDLIHKPVLNPQAGRPDPRPAKKPKAAEVKRTVQTAPAAVQKKPKPAVKPLVKPVQTSKPKPKPKPVPKPVVKTDTRNEQQVQSALDEIRERQKRQAERDAMKEKLAKLTGKSGAATVAADVPVGMPDGTGDEVGISALAFVQAFIQENWALSPYLLDQSRIRDLEAKATLTYAASGEMIRYRINTPSGNQQFDDSLKKAITKSKQLPQPLPKQLDLLVTFNLKEMARGK